MQPWPAAGSQALSPASPDADTSPTGPDSPSRKANVDRSYRSDVSASSFGTGVTADDAAVQERKAVETIERLQASLTDNACAEHRQSNALVTQAITILFGAVATWGHDYLGA